MFKAVKKPIAIDVVTYEEIIQYGSHQVPMEYAVKMDAVMESLVIEQAPLGGLDPLFQEPTIYVKTKEGRLIMRHFDHLIIGAFGEVYPIAKEIFEATYDIVKGD